MVRLDEKEIGKRNIKIKLFDGISDLVQHCKTSPINHNSFEVLSSNTGTKSFTLTDNYYEAERLLLSGWSQGAEKLTKSLKIANTQASSKEVKKTVYDIVGFQASVPRYLQGVPTNMINKKVVKKKQNVVTLVKAITYLGSVSADQIMSDSVKFIQIVQAIEAKGIRVNIDVFFHSVKNGEEMMMRLPIKKASERLNISKMSFPLLHPSFLRRIIFRAMETEMRVKNSWYGYGTVGSKQQVEPLLKENEYFIPVLISQKEMENIINKTN
jgi:hypothetical protein